MAENRKMSKTAARDKETLVRYFTKIAQVVLLVLTLCILPSAKIQAGNHVMKNAGISEDGILRFDAVEGANLYRVLSYSEGLGCDVSYYNLSLDEKPELKNEKSFEVDMDEVMRNTRCQRWTGTLRVQAVKYDFKANKAIWESNKLLAGTYTYEHPIKMNDAYIEDGILHFDAYSPDACYSICLHNTINADSNHDHRYVVEKGKPTHDSEHLAIDLKRFCDEFCAESAVYEVSVSAFQLDYSTRDNGVGSWGGYKELDYTDVTYAGTYTYENPRTIQNFTISEDGIVQFDAVEGADAYHINFYKITEKGKEYIYYSTCDAAQYSGKTVKINICELLTQKRAYSGKYGVQLYAYKKLTDADKKDRFYNAYYLENLWQTELSEIQNYDFLRQFDRSIKLRELSLGIEEIRSVWLTESDILNKVILRNEKLSFESNSVVHETDSSDRLIYQKNIRGTGRNFVRGELDDNETYYFNYTIRSKDYRERITVDENDFRFEPKWYSKWCVYLDHIEQKNDGVVICFGMKTYINNKVLLGGIKASGKGIKANAENYYYYPSFDQKEALFIRKESVPYNVICSPLYTTDDFYEELHSKPQAGKTYYFTISVVPENDRDVIECSKVTSINCNVSIDGYDVSFLGKKYGMLYFSMMKRVPPITGQVFLKNTESMICPGTVLGLTMTNVPAGYQVQWQVSSDETGSDFSDILNAKQKTYEVRAGNVGKFVRAKVTVDGYRGELYSNNCLIRPIPVMEGDFSYSAPFVGTEITAYRDAVLNEIYYTAKELGKSFHYQWQISDDGMNGWKDIKGATTDTYMTLAADEDKYLRLTATADGYSGMVLGSPVKIVKQDNVLKPVGLLLETAEPYTTVTVTNAKADQEYIFKYGVEWYTEADWRDAVSPTADGTLVFNVEKERSIRVFTRFKETETTKAGTQVANKYIYSGNIINLAGIELSRQDDWIQPFVGQEVSILTQPENWTGTLGGKKIVWDVEGGDVRIYSDSACLKEIEPGVMNQILTGDEDKYMKVWVVAYEDCREVKITARMYDSTEKKLWGEAFWKFEAGFPLHYVDFGSGIIIRRGEGMTLGYRNYRSKYTDVPYDESRLTFVKDALSPSDDLEIEFQKNQYGEPTGLLSVKVPENADYGTYVYHALIDAKETPVPSRLTIIVPDNMATVTLKPDNGSGTEKAFLVEKGKEFILPDLPDSFDIPADKEFVGWEMGGKLMDVYDGITVTEDVTVKASWMTHVHDMTLVEEYLPTCTEPGEVEHYRCKLCGKGFYDKEGTEYSSSFEIPPTGHRSGGEVKENEEYTDCTSAQNYDAVRYCEVCGEEISRIHRTEAASGHILMHIPAKDAGCIQDGCKEHWECKRCKEKFYKSDGIEKVADPSDVLLHAKGHDWDEWIVTKQPSSTEEGERARICKRDPAHKETEKIPPLENPKRDRKDISDTNPVKAEELERRLLYAKNDKDAVGSTFTLLKAGAVSKSASSIKLSWTKVPGATEYVIYGNRCGKRFKYKKITTVKGTSYTAKKLSKGTYYKCIVVARKGKEALAASKTIHVVTKGGMHGNHSKVKLNKKSLTLHAGQIITLKATVKKERKKVSIHRAVAWESDNISVATVKKGKVTAVGKGNCCIYAYAQNGTYGKVKISVR